MNRASEFWLKVDNADHHLMSKCKCVFRYMYMLIEWTAS